MCYHYIKGRNILIGGASTIKDKVIWVDFSAKKRGKNKMRKFLDKIMNNIKLGFKASSKRDKPKTLDSYHKSIL